MKIDAKILVAVGLTLPCVALARQLRQEVLRAIHHGAMAEIRLKVLDEEDSPVTNACVTTIFDMSPNPWSIHGYTDSKGIFVAKGKTNGNYVDMFVNKSGFYDSRKRITYIQMYAEHDVKEGKWQPYGETQTIRLRKIRKPVDLLCETLFIDIGETNKWIGFDLTAKDFVRPLGKGEITDFEIMAQWDGKAPIGSKMCYGELRFTQPFTGGYYSENVTESSYPYVYEAKRDDNYAVSDIKVINRMGDPGVTKIPFRDDSVLVARTRCVIDKMTGELKSANYGYIKNFMISPSWGDKCTLSLFYVFNPTPNDMNLEPIRQ